MDTTDQTTTRMPIRDIQWSNPEWFRSFMGDLDPLRRSIKEVGLQIPILVTEDLLVIDGARRIMAYTALGRKEIPVVVTNDWNKIIEHLEQTRVAEASGLPFEYMGWEDLETLWRVAIIPLYAPVRVSRIQATRKAREHGDKVPTNGRRPVNNDLGRAFGMEANEVKVLRDVYAAVRGIERDQKPTAGQLKTLKDFVQRVAARNPGRTFKGMYSLRNFLREVSRGAIQLDEVKDVIEAREMQLNRPVNKITVWEDKRRNNPATGSEVVQNFCSVLSHFGEEADRLLAFEADLEVDALSKQIRLAVNRFNALRRRLESVAQLQGSEQES